MTTAPVRVKFGTVKEQLDKARVALLFHHPFFASLLHMLKPTPKPSLPTMATDGVHLFYNPTFVEETRPSHLIGVLAHEVLHPAFKHHLRRGSRNPKLWNKACDYVINPIVRKAGLELPPDVLDDSRFYGMDAETVYSQLEQESEQNGDNGQSSGNGNSSSQSSGGNAPGQPSGDPGDDSSDGSSSEDQDEPAGTDSFPGDYGSVMDYPGEDEDDAVTQADMAAQEQAWTSAVQQAHLTATMAGKLPAGVDRVAEEATAEKVHWTEHLRKSYYSTVPTDYSWARPNRRFIHAGLYLPGTVRENVGNLVTAIDCSGSIANRVLGMFQDAMNDLIGETRPNQVDVLYFDEIIHRVDTYHNGEEITLNPAGGGGTSFHPIFDWIKEQGVTPQAVIILTDLWGSFPTEAPGYPVIWLSTSPRYKQGPFGETISLAAA